MTLPLAQRLSLMLVTDRRLARRPLDEAVRRALAGGVTAVMLREKDLPTDALVVLGRGVRDACRAAGALFLVNRDIDAAERLGADGVHFGFDSPPRSRARRLLGAVGAGPTASGAIVVVGRSTHDLDELETALQPAEAGADYVTFGPVYETASKKGILEPRGAARLAQAVRFARNLPVLALGGVTTETAAAVRRSGAAGIACISAILDSDDETAAAAALKTAWETRE